MPNSNQKSSDSLKILGLGLAEILSILAVIAIFFGVLNYFNVISLSTLYPNFFGSLPQQSSPIKNPEDVKVFTCPTDINCNSDEAIYFSKSIPPFYGIGYTNLAKGTKLLAIFPGKITQGASIAKDGKKNNLIAIINNTLGLEVDYSFIGTPDLKNKKTIKQGEIIGLLSGTASDKGYFNKEYDLIVSVLDLKTKKFLRLKTTFEQKIER